MTSPLLDLSSLLQPIPGDNPAGSPVPFDVRDKLKSAREEKASDTPGGDAGRADWHGIVRLATETLTNTSKDLDVAARLTEAVVKLHGFAGLHDGLKLLLGLVEECWDRMYPAIEDGDVEVRAGPFYWLDDPIKGARFPSTLRLVPLVWYEGEGIGCLDWMPPDKWAKRVTQEEFDRALLATSAELIAGHVEALKESHALLDRLVAVLNERMGSAAPGLVAVREAVEECQRLAGEIASRKGPVAGTAEQGAAVQEGTAAAPSGPLRSATSRAEAYRQLQQAADLLQELEPHSPIPYLVRRAVELGAMPFPDLMRALIRNAEVLAEMNRELGIKEKEPESSS
jgi:type VI secretion system protein ImpA